VRHSLRFDKLDFNPPDPFPPGTFRPQRGGYELIEH
jgi:hypothetical protein